MFFLGEVPEWLMVNDFGFAKISRRMTWTPTNVTESGFEHTTNFDFGGLNFFFHDFIC